MEEGNVESKKEEVEVTNETSLELRPTRPIPQDPRPVMENAKDVKNCPACNIEFGVFVGKHHCRGCGKVFCKKHCDEWLMLPDSFGYPKEPVRVCDPCFKKYNFLDFSKRFDEYGSPDATSIVLLPGALIGRIITPELRAALAAYHVIAVDLPGLGACKGEKLTNENAIELIRNVILEHTKAKKAIVFGISMGGHLAMKFADKHPELCIALVLGACVNEYYGVGATMFFKSVNLVYSMCSGSLKSKFVPKSIPKHIKIDDLKIILTTGMQYEAWADCCSIMAEPHEGYYRKVLSTYQGRVLFIHGSKDFRTKEKEFLNCAKMGKLSLIDGADHFVLFDPLRRGLFAAKVKEFVDSIEQ